MYPKIIDAEIFHNVQLKFKKNKYGRKSEKANYLLRKKWLTISEKSLLLQNP